MTLLEQIELEGLQNKDFWIKAEARLGYNPLDKIHSILDSAEFMNNLYDGLEEKKREELGQFYTPGRICIKMIDKFNCDTLEGKNIMDPTCGSGNLLIACLIAGADYDKLYGNEYDAIAVELCRKRINAACKLLGKPAIPYYHIHQGNALQARCLTDFSDWYIRQYNPEYINDLEYAQGVNKNGYKLSWEIENKIANEKHNPPVQQSLFDF